ncbi:hypothetical protein BDV39DRAFT_205834 [Aspergillus sergii]|uniref:Uncharacterized protein n=1 Tax=Aspergillus sergii TaxID=1034303 RepID=A0A5N6X2Z7_9EURO|nr:hypothetical protein BDV39DRAFT_205834 [Aspergillus sergii]
MKVFQIIAYLTLSANAAHALSTLDPVQSINADAIIAQAKKDNVGALGCEVAITTGLSQTGLKILANKRVPSSQKYKHDDFGSQGDSIGIFQQSARKYKDIACLMKADCSASLFFKDLKTLEGWENMTTKDLVLSVNRGGTPAAFLKYISQARNVCKAGGL